MENRDPPEDDYLLAVSVERAASMSGIGRTTLYAALTTGALRSLKVGRRRLIPVDALKAWLAAHEAP
jgi:excisionase family DNA binding protein